MIFKNILRILASYRFSLIKIISFELIYIFRGYKGNKFDFTDNNIMTDNIPCPYYFLVRIKKILQDNNFHTFLDMGCGSGRAIDFFNRNFSNKKFIGIEYFSSHNEYCRKIFKNQHNVRIVQANFIKSDFLQYDADCYFFNSPFRQSSDIAKIMGKIINFNLRKRKIFFIFINIDNKIIESLKYIQCIECCNINDRKGYSIYYLNNNQTKKFI